MPLTSGAFVYAANNTAYVIYLASDQRSIAMRELNGSVPWENRHESRMEIPGLKYSLDEIDCAQQIDTSVICLSTTGYSDTVTYKIEAVRSNDEEEATFLKPFISEVVYRSVIPDSFERETYFVEGFMVVDALLITKGRLFIKQKRKLGSCSSTA